MNNILEALLNSGRRVATHELRVEQLGAKEYRVTYVEECGKVIEVELVLAADCRGFWVIEKVLAEKELMLLW